jgi:hypothetical protein
MSGETAQERLVARAIDILGRPGAFLDQTGPHYAVRGGGDRRRRPLLQLDEAGFRALVERPV